MTEILGSLEDYVEREYYVIEKGSPKSAKMPW